MGIFDLVGILRLLVCMHTYRGAWTVTMQQHRIRIRINKILRVIRDIKITSIIINQLIRVTKDLKIILIGLLGLLEYLGPLEKLLQLFWHY